MFAVVADDDDEDDVDDSYVAVTMLMRNSSWSISSSIASVVRTSRE